MTPSAPDQEKTSPAALRFEAQPDFREIPLDCGADDDTFHEQFQQYPQQNPYAQHQQNPYQQPRPQSSGPTNGEE